MSVHPGMLIAYDDAGSVISTLGYMVSYDPDGSPRGLVDFLGHEEGGGDHTDIWVVSNAKGSKAWPEWLGGEAHNYQVELQGPPGKKHLSALVHKATGQRRDRAVIDAAIEARIAVANGAPVDISDLVGGPDRPLGSKASVPQVKGSLPVKQATS